MADSTIKPLLPIWPVAPAMSADKEKRRKKPATPLPEHAVSKGQTDTADENGRRHIDLYA